MYRAPTPTLRTLKEASQMGKKDTTPDLLFSFWSKNSIKDNDTNGLHFSSYPGRRLSFAYQGQLKHLRAAFDLRKLGLRRVTFTFGLLISMESNQRKFI